MPSPTDSTWPTSETSASWPKFLICSFRMAEISAARISISGPLSSRILIAFNLVRSDESTMRLPTLTISPPMMAGSTLTSRSMSLPPVTDLSALLSASRFLSLSCSATVTCAVTSPRWRATSVRKSRIMSRTANSRRLVVMTRRKLAARPLMPALSRMAESACSCSSAPNTGLRTSRARSGLAAISASNCSRSVLTRVDGFVFERQLEQGGGVTARHAGNDRVFACQRGRSFSLLHSQAGRRRGTAAQTAWNPRGNSDSRGRRGSPRKPPEIEG